MENQQEELACQGDTTVESNTAFDVEWDCTADGGYDVACHNCDVNDVHWSRINDMECSIDPSYHIGDVGQEVFIQNLIQTGMMSSGKDSYQKSCASGEDIAYLSSASTEYFSCYSDDSEEEINTSIPLPNSGTEQQNIQLTFGEVTVNVGVTVTPRHTYNKQYSKNGQVSIPSQSSSQMLDIVSKLGSITDPEQIHCIVEKNYRLMDSPTSNEQPIAEVFSQVQRGEVKEANTDYDSSVQSAPLAYDFQVDFEGMILNERTSSIIQSEYNGPGMEYSDVVNHSREECERCENAQRSTYNKDRYKGNENTTEIDQSKRDTNPEDVNVKQRYNELASQLVENVIKSSVRELLLQYWRVINNHKKSIPAISAGQVSSPQRKVDKTFYSSIVEKDAKEFRERMNTTPKTPNLSPYTEMENNTKLKSYKFDYDVDLPPHCMSCKPKENISKPESQVNIKKGIRCLWNISSFNKCFDIGDRSRLCFNNFAVKTDISTADMIKSNVPSIAGQTIEKEKPRKDTSAEGQQLKPGIRIVKTAKITSRGKDSECTGNEIKISCKRETAREQSAWGKETPKNKNMNTGVNVSVQTEFCCMNRIDYDSASAMLSRKITMAAVKELTLEIWRMWNMNISEKREKLEVRKIVDVVILRANEQLIHEQCHHSKSDVFELSHTQTTCDTAGKLKHVYSMKNENHDKTTGKPVPTPKNNIIKEKSIFESNYQSNKLVPGVSNDTSDRSDSNEIPDQGKLKQNEIKDNKSGKSHLPVPVPKKNNLTKEKPVVESSHQFNKLVPGFSHGISTRSDTKAISGQVNLKNEIRDKGTGKSHLPVPVPKVTNCVNNQMIHGRNHKANEFVSDVVDSKTARNVTNRKPAEVCPRQNKSQNKILPKSHLPVSVSTEKKLRKDQLLDTNIYKKTAVNTYMPLRNMSTERIKVNKRSETFKRDSSRIPVYKKEEQLKHNGIQRKSTYRGYGIENPRHKRLREVTMSEMSIQDRQKYRKISSYDEREIKVKPKKESGTNVFKKAKSDDEPKKSRGDHNVSTTKHSGMSYLDYRSCQKYSWHKGVTISNKQRLCDSGEMKSNEICYTRGKLPFKQRGIFFELFRTEDVSGNKLIEKYKEIEIEQISKLLSKYAVVGAKMELSVDYLQHEYTRQKAIRNEQKKITRYHNTTRGSSKSKPRTFCLLCLHNKERMALNLTVPTESTMKFERQNSTGKPNDVNTRNSASDKSTSVNNSCKMCSRPNSDDELTHSSMYHHHMKSGQGIYHSKKEQNGQIHSPGDFEFHNRIVKCALCKKRRLHLQ